MAIERHRVTDAPCLIQPDLRRFPAIEELFGNANPLEVEIGCGKAKFLIPRAQEHPGINFLGIDVMWKWMKYAVQRSDKRRLANIRFIKADARSVVKYGIPERSVSIFHIYFPDPWPKRRHRKRRLVTGEFLRLLHSRLRDDGLIELATDHEDYFLQMKRAVGQSGVEWRGVIDSVNERLFTGLSKTNYEIKYEAAGRALHYLELQK
jgi:tRNA (guanine-N7-)-methyltransferase